MLIYNLSTENCMNNLLSNYVDGFFFLILKNIIFFCLMFRVPTCCLSKVLWINLCHLLSKCLLKFLISGVKNLQVIIILYTKLHVPDAPTTCSAQCLTEILALSVYAAMIFIVSNAVETSYGLYWDLYHHRNSFCLTQNKHPFFFFVCFMLWKVWF